MQADLYRLEDAFTGEVQIGFSKVAGRIGKFIPVYRHDAKYSNDCLQFTFYKSNAFPIISQMSRVSLKEIIYLFQDGSTICFKKEIDIISTTDLTKFASIHLMKIRALTSKGLEVFSFDSIHTDSPYKTAEDGKQAIRIMAAKFLEAVTYSAP